MSVERGEEFLRLMQQHVADGSISPSTVRRMGPPGTAKVIREFLRQVDIVKAFAAVNSEPEFTSLLNDTTDLLVAKLPGGQKMHNAKLVGNWGERWGVSRKCLNIFLYECLNNRWLCEAYPGLCLLEPWLEVPLDSYVGTALRKRGKDEVGAWNSVIDLTKDNSDAYQVFARKLAAQRDYCRVHLDLDFYNERKDD